MKNAPPLQKVDGREKLTIPADGFLQIPNKLQSSRIEHTYKTVSGNVIPQLDLERPKLSYDDAMKTIFLEDRSITALRYSSFAISVQFSIKIALTF